MSERDHLTALAAFAKEVILAIWDAHRNNADLDGSDVLEEAERHGVIVLRPDDAEGNDAFELAPWLSRIQKEEGQDVIAARKLLDAHSRDSLYMAGVTTGWNAAQAGDPAAAIARIEAAYLTVLREASDELKAARATIKVWEEGQATLRSAPIATGNNGWRPIAEAPKEGTFLLFHERWVTMGCFDDDEGEWIDQRVPEYHDATIKPTHWQPLPSPPITETENGQEFCVFGGQPCPNTCAREGRCVWNAKADGLAAPAVRSAEGASHPHPEVTEEMIEAGLAADMLGCSRRLSNAERFTDIYRAMKAKEPR